MHFVSFKRLAETKMQMRMPQKNPGPPGITNPAQLQRITLERNFFWHGILALNENGGHTFFDVRLKKSVKGSPLMIGLFTNDIPPFPLSSTDTFWRNSKLRAIRLLSPMILVNGSFNFLKRHGY